MTIEIIKSGKPVASSQNLRGLLSYARKSFACRVAVSKIEGAAAHVYVLFDDGAECRTRFESYAAALSFFRSRRSWALSECRCSDAYTVFHILCGDARY